MRLSKLTQSRTARRLLVFVFIALLAWLSDRGNKAQCLTCKVYSPPVFKEYPEILPVQYVKR